MAVKKAFANWALMIFLLAIAGAVVAVPICNVDSSQLSLCYPAVSGTSPAPPTRGCCSVIKNVDISCLCGYKGYLAMYRINPKLVFALPRKCGINIKIPCVAQF